SMSKRQSDSVQMTDDSGEKTFSTTNVQVEGVDEADIVKTDGEYLYILSYDELIIARADGKNTKVVSRTFVDLSRKAVSSNRQNSTSAEIASDDVSMVSPVEFPTPMEMFLDGDRLIVLLTNYDANIYQESSRYNMPLSTQGAATFAITYDISDRMQPRKVAQSGQDGDYVTSRMQDGVIYLVTSYYIYQRPEFDDVRTFVPCLFAGDVRETMAPRDIIVPQSPSETGYTVITSISTKTGEHLDGQSLFGYISTVYMSHDSLVIAASVYEEKIIDRWIEDQYRVEHRRDGYHTHLAFFDIDRGDLTFVTESVVPGELLNQFSIDQYQDTTRVVTTVSTQEMKLYTDRKRGFMNYERIEDSPQTNALFVLDRKGEMIGKLTDLAPGEQVYSVRFAGEVGYFVTFRQVDPLFAIDLSDPRDPRVLSALKIPGFSQYLHVYGKGLLFGLGRDADEETGITGPIKLSMFDVSDPRDVRELDKLVTDIDHSEALYNHKAILVLPQIDLIAFPTFEGYALFGYQDGGFVSRGTIEFPNSYSARGVVIDDLLYVCTASSIGVFELNTFTPLITIWF
ncbi:MAG: beta-propeller domain-containing protein, partial [Coriobacteriia bacterium]|nr:beta-propeller domain-containing protein [Coriobacteriia bacterium]